MLLLSSKRLVGSSSSSIVVVKTKDKKLCSLTQEVQDPIVEALAKFFV